MNLKADMKQNLSNLQELINNIIEKTDWDNLGKIHTYAIVTIIMVFMAFTFKG